MMTGAASTSAIALSRTETETLCLKATRGVGYSWGMAEEAARAAGWLSAAGVDGPRALLGVLQVTGLTAPRIGAGEWGAGKAALCPLLTGAALCDHVDLPEGALQAGIRLHAVQTPVLLVPFLAHCADALGRAITLEAGGAGLTIGRGVVGDLAALADLGVADVTLALADGPLPGPIRTGPTHTGPTHTGLAAILPETLAALEQLALCTTVPASDASRQSGAGAAIDDND